MKPRANLFGWVTVIVKAAGVPAVRMTSFATYLLDKVVFTGAMPTRFSTDDGVVRSFCEQCGSPIAYESTEKENQIDLHLGLFDDLEQIKPRNHTFYAEKVSWLQADDHLPKNTGSTEQA